MFQGGIEAEYTLLQVRQKFELIARVFSQNSFIDRSMRLLRFDYCNLYAWSTYYRCLYQAKNMR